MTQELKLRIMSGLVLAALVLSATFAGGAAFRLVAIMIALAIYAEWTAMTRIADDDKPGLWAGWALQIVLAIFLFLNKPLLLLAVLVAAVLAFYWRSTVKHTSPWLAGGLLYAGLAGLSLIFLRENGAAGLIAVLFLFATVWTTDIAAYFTGKALQGPKLAPAISPGKTWSGAAGGTVSAAIVGSGLLAMLTSTPLWTSIVLAITLSVVSQIGDLFESFLKRRFGVKDSGHLIPGHGGVMDRVDGLVFASILMFLLTLVWGSSPLVLQAG